MALSERAQKMVDALEASSVTEKFVEYLRRHVRTGSINEIKLEPGVREAVIEVVAHYDEKVKNGRLRTGHLRSRG